MMCVHVLVRFGSKIKGVYNVFGFIYLLSCFKSRYSVPFRFLHCTYPPPPLLFFLSFVLEGEWVGGGGGVRGVVRMENTGSGSDGKYWFKSILLNSFTIHFSHFTSLSCIALH